MFGEKRASDFAPPVRSLRLKIAMALPGPSDLSQNLQDGPAQPQLN